MNIMEQSMKNVMAASSGRTQECDAVNNIRRRVVRESLPNQARQGLDREQAAHERAHMTLGRQFVAETLGTAFLLATVVGSGIMGDRLAGGSISLALLACTLATGAGLVALILALGSVSGAHFNPVITLLDAWQGSTRWRDVPPYFLAQIIGALAGVAAAHLMFGEPLFFASQHVRTGLALWWSEFVATFGLVAVIIGCSRSRPNATPFAVAAYIAAACWFTASTAFANPAVTLARAMSDTFVGIRPIDVPGFIVAQIAGALLGGGVLGWLYPRHKH